MPSTLIRNTRYDPATRILSVWFVKSGRQYDYLEVAPETYAAFRQAFSKGRFFNSFIRDRHRFRLVESSNAG
jgi:KTSC domain